MKFKIGDVVKPLPHKYHAGQIGTITDVSYNERYIVISVKFENAICDFANPNSLELIKSYDSHVCKLVCKCDARKSVLF